jgi:fructoselysine 6-kinase
VAVTSDVACVGDNCVDVALEDAAEELAGGNALNVAVELARAGRATSYFGAVGDDAHASVILEAARAAGVDVAGVRQMRGATGVTVVARDENGERIFVREDYGVSAAYRLDDSTAALIAGHRWAHFARQADLADWALRLRREGVRISCDLGVETEPGTLEAVGPHLDVVRRRPDAGRASHRGAGCRRRGGRGDLRRARQRRRSRCGALACTRRAG